MQEESLDTAAGKKRSLQPSSIEEVSSLSKLRPIESFRNKASASSPNFEKNSQINPNAVRAPLSDFVGKSSGGKRVKGAKNDGISQDKRNAASAEVNIPAAKRIKEVIAAKTDSSSISPLERSNVAASGSVQEESKSGSGVSQTPTGNLYNSKINQLQMLSRQRAASDRQDLSLGINSAYVASLSGQRSMATANAPIDSYLMSSRLGGISTTQSSTLPSSLSFLPQSTPHPHGLFIQGTSHPSSLPSSMTGQDVASILRLTSADGISPASLLIEPSRQMDSGGRMGGIVPCTTNSFLYRRIPSLQGGFQLQGQIPGDNLSLLSVGGSSLLRGGFFGNWLPHGAGSGTRAESDGPTSMGVHSRFVPNLSRGERNLLIPNNRGSAQFPTAVDMDQQTRKIGNSGGSPASARSPLALLPIPAIDESPVAHFNQRTHVPLATDEDQNWLSEFLCFVRLEFVEIFRANHEDVRSRNSSKKVIHGQVGIRCRFCAHLPLSARASRSSSYPSSLSRIYQSLTMMLRDHFGKCNAIPLPLKQRFLDLKGKTSQGATDSKHYWVYSAMKRGLIDSESRIWVTDRPEASIADVPPFGGANKSQPQGDDVRKNESSSPAPLVFPEDRKLVSEFLYNLMTQVQLVRMEESERTGNRKSLAIGLPGVGCRHCCQSNRKGLCRLFPVRRRTLPNKINDLYEHIRRCTLCPSEIKENLALLREQELVKEVKNAGEKEFFDLIWSRMGHGTAQAEG